MIYNIRGVLLSMILLMSMSYGGDSSSYAKVVNLGIKEVASFSRMMKNYTMIQMNSSFHDPQKDLDETVAVYGKLCDSLLSLPVDDTIKKSLVECNVLWRDAKHALATKPTKDSMMVLRSKIMPLRKSVRKMIRYAKDKDGTDRTKKLYECGKLCVIPQKLASTYMFLNRADKVAAAKKVLKEQGELYETLLSKLEGYLSSDSAKKYLTLMRKDFEYLRLLESPDAIFVPALVYKKTNAMSHNAVKLLETI